MQNHTVVGWLVGLLGVSLIVGSFVSFLVWLALRRWFNVTVQRLKWQVPPQAVGRIPVQPILIGILERLFFTILIAFNIPAVAGGLVTWILVKMVSGWNRFTGSDDLWRRMLAFNALINNIVSLLFAVIGGLIANGSIPLR